MLECDVQYVFVVIRATETMITRLYFWKLYELGSASTFIRIFQNQFLQHSLPMMVL